MKKIAQLVGVLALLSVLAPAIAFANGGGEKDRGSGFHLNFHGIHLGRTTQGSITAVGTSSFTLKAKNGTVYTVNTGTAKLIDVMGKVLALTDIKVNDNVWVKGKINGSTIAATLVQDFPANTHRAGAKGTVTAVNGNSFTIQSTHDGVPYTVNVTTNASTTFSKTGTSTAASISDVIVGAKVRVKGLWGEILNVLNAIKIRIK